MKTKKCYKCKESKMKLLKTCPFCGEQPVSESYHNKGWEVYCPTIECVMVLIVRATKELAEEIWNNRTELFYDKLPKKLNGSDLCAVREDFGWWVGYESEDLSKEVAASGKTLDEAFLRLYEYWFKSGRINSRDKC